MSYNYYCKYTVAVKSQNIIHILRNVFEEISHSCQKFDETWSILLFLNVPLKAFIDITVTSVHILSLYRFSTIIMIIYRLNQILDLTCFKQMRLQ